MIKTHATNLGVHSSHTFFERYRRTPPTQRLFQQQAEDDASPIIGDEMKGHRTEVDYIVTRELMTDLTQWTLPTRAFETSVQFMCPLIMDWQKKWRARRESNPQPPDP